MPENNVLSVTYIVVVVVVVVVVVNIGLYYTCMKDGMDIIGWRWI